MSTNEHPLARTVEYRAKPWETKKLESLLAEYARFHKRIEYPYPVEGFRSILAPPNCYLVVTFPDEWSKFHGVHRLEDVARRHDAATELADLRRRIAQTLTSATRRDLDFASELSYSPKDKGE